MATTTSLQSFQALDDTGRWIIHKAPDIDAAWELNKALERHKLPPVSQRVDSRKQRFQSFVHNLLSSQGDQEAYNAFRSATSWEDVRQEAEQAIDQYVNQGKTWNNPFRRAKRLVGSTATRLEFLTQLIPDGDYLGVLCGGLKLAYNAANRNRQVREVIIGALESLDAEINSTKILIREYAWDENIRKTADDLYVAVLDAVEAIMVWIEKRKGFRGQLVQAGKAIARQNDYGSELETQVTTNIKEKVEAFERAVRTCLSLETRAIATNVVTVGKTVDILDGKIDQTAGELRKVTAAGYTVESLLRDIRESMSEYMERDLRHKELMATNQESIRQMLQAQQTQLLIAGVTGPGNAPNPYIITPNHRSPRPHSPEAIIGTRQILHSLNLVNAGDHDTASQIITQTRTEREFIIYHGQHLPQRATRTLTTVLQDARFTSWSNPTTGSSTLLVIGSDVDALNTHGHGARVSPFSYMAVMLAGSFTDLSSVYTASFFCHLHSDPASINDPLLGPSGLLRSLIAQIILQHPSPSLISQYLLSAVGHDLTQLNNFLHAVQCSEIPSLCTLFDTVLDSFTHPAIASKGTSIVICTIDSANSFGSEYHIAQMDQVMRYLDSLVSAVSSANNTGLIFKLLITSPTGLDRGRHWFPYGVGINVSGGMGSGELLGGIEGLEANSGVLVGLAERATTPISSGIGGNSWALGDSSPRMGGGNSYGV